MGDRGGGAGRRVIGVRGRTKGDRGWGIGVEGQDEG